MKTILAIILLAAALVLAVPATAQPVLRYSPADTVLAPGQTTRVGIYLDDVQDVRTIEVFVDFDPSVVATLGGGPGLLYSDSGFFLFDGFEETAPGSWHGYCVVMGSEDYITGPGELFYWEVEALAAGHSPIATVEVGLTAPVSGLIDGVTLPSATIGVNDPDVAPVELPESHGALHIAPNPFNPLTRVQFTLAEAGSARLEVLDVAGRRVRLLHQGPLVQGAHSFAWNGRDKNGLPQPTGLYFFRLESAQGVQLSKGVLVK